jgi:hypothetical protein
MEPAIPMATEQIRPLGIAEDLSVRREARRPGRGLRLRVLSANEALAQLLTAQEVAAV